MAEWNFSVHIEEQTQYKLERETIVGMINDSGISQRKISAQLAKIRLGMTADAYRTLGIICQMFCSLYSDVSE